MPKEITFYAFLGENRDPSEIYANSNLRNLTHITQKPSCLYVFHLHAQKNHSLKVVMRRAPGVMQNRTPKACSSRDVSGTC